jgi:hypothetical protein
MSQQWAEIMAANQGVICVICWAEFMLQIKERFEGENGMHISSFSTINRGHAE